MHVARRVAGLLLAATATVANQAGAAIAERVVAVVGDRPILLTELRHRAKPNLLRVAAASGGASFQAAAESETFRETLNRMIDERLEDQVAARARIHVTSEQIDRGVELIAKRAGVSVRDVLDEVQRQGLSEQEFRDEIGRQVLEGQLVELRVRSRVRVGEHDARSEYDAYVREWRSDVVDLRVLALQPPQRNAIELALQLVQLARTGANFCQLVLKYTGDPTCGSRGPQKLENVAPQVRSVVAGMRTFDVSDPISVSTPAGIVTVIVQLQPQPPPPAFEAVKPEMIERATSRRLEEQRRAWLQELRRSAYIDVRL